MKSTDRHVLVAGMTSLPSRERGLKFSMRAIVTIMLFVAPFAGAWIEIALIAELTLIGAGRSLRGSVD